MASGRSHFISGSGWLPLGWGLAVGLIRDTQPFVALETSLHPMTPSRRPSLTRSFADVTWRKPYLFGVTQAGLVKNLNDGLAWGIFPLFFASRGLELGRIDGGQRGYPTVWGVLQLGTGWASDATGRKPLIVTGMILQGLAISFVGAVDFFGGWVVAVSLLGSGTAFVYPTLLAAIGDAVPPEERATSLGVYRFWRDSGLLVGALAAGALADLFGFEVAIQAVAVLTMASGVVTIVTVRNSIVPEPLS